MNLDDLIACSRNENLEFSSFVEGTIKQGKQTLMSYIGPILGWILVQLTRYIVSMIITIQKDVLMLFVLCDLKWCLL
jgi:hypothetical protein